MHVSTALQLVSTLAIVAGVLFAGVQIRLARRQRSHEAELLLVASFQSVEFMRAMKAILALPDSLSKADTEGRFGEQDFQIYYWLGTMKSLGTLVRDRQGVKTHACDDRRNGGSADEGLSLHRDDAHRQRSMPSLAWAPCCPPWCRPVSLPSPACR